MFFITKLNGVITGLHNGDMSAAFADQSYAGHETEEVPSVDGIRVLDRVEFYTRDCTGWTRKTDRQLVEEELMETPEGHVLEGDAFRPMTSEERIIAGLDEPRPGWKIENGEVVEMGLQEKLLNGFITQEEHDEILAGQNRDELNRRLAELQTPEVLAEAELDEEFAAERRERLRALLAVRLQEGWPLSAVWPEW